METRREFLRRTTVFGCAAPMLLRAAGSNAADEVGVQGRDAADRALDLAEWSYFWVGVEQAHLARGTVVWVREDLAPFLVDLVQVVVILDEDGHPMHHRGVVGSEPGLYFVGLVFLYSLSSVLIGGVGRDAEFVAAHIASRAAGDRSSSDGAATSTHFHLRAELPNR